MAIEDILVWTIPPDWSGEITESLDWLTMVLSSPTRSEQRMALRIAPRRSFEMTFKPVGPIRTLFDMTMMRASGQELYVPLWQEFERLTAPATGTVLSLDTVDMEFSEFVFIQGENPFSYEIGEIDSIAVDSITLVDGLVATWPRGSRVYPLLKCRIEDKSSVARKADRAFQSRVKFSFTGEYPATFGGTISP